jgi:hypothetical protein
VAFYNGRAGAENLIKEANNDAGLAAHPSGRFDMNRNYFQMVMLACCSTAKSRQRWPPHYAGHGAVAVSGDEPDLEFSTQ